KLDPKGSDYLESFGKTNPTGLTQCSMWSRRNENIKAGIKRESSRNKTHWNRGAARPAGLVGPAISNACRSLLIPLAHFGGGGAWVFAFGAGRFLPLVGAVGSSCA